MGRILRVHFCYEIWRRGLNKTLNVSGLQNRLQQNLPTSWEVSVTVQSSTKRSCRRVRRKVLVVWNTPRLSSFFVCGVCRTEAVLRLTLVYHFVNQSGQLPLMMTGNDENPFCRSTYRGQGPLWNRGTLDKRPFSITPKINKN